MADAPLNRTLLNNEKLTITLTPKNGASPTPGVVAPPPPVVWSQPTGATLINLVVAPDQQSAAVHTIPAMIGQSIVKFDAADGGSGSGTVVLTIQSSLTSSMNAALSPNSPMP